jgi:hypothetical protein
MVSSRMSVIIMGTSDDSALLAEKSLLTFPTKSSSFLDLYLAGGSDDGGGADVDRSISCPSEPLIAASPDRRIANSSTRSCCWG